MKIPVQIKGTTKSLKNNRGEIKFSVEKKHLQNYKRDNGVLFFVVKIDKGKRQAEEVYYSDLSPLKIHHILRHKNFRGNNVVFRELSADIKSIEQLFINFSQARLIQASFDNNHIHLNDKILKECKSFTLYPTADRKLCAPVGVR